MKPCRSVAIRAGEPDVFGGEKRSEGLPAPASGRGSVTTVTEAISATSRHTRAVIPGTGSPLSLRPVGLARRLGDHDVLQEGDRLLQPFGRRHDAVLVLDAQHVIVADQPQVRDDVLPHDRVVAVPDGAEDPRTLLLER